MVRAAYYQKKQNPGQLILNRVSASSDIFLTHYNIYFVRSNVTKHRFLFAVVRQIIVNSVIPAATSKFHEQSMPSEISDEWGRNLYFWQSFSCSQTEPDIVIELGQAVILIEVKYNSDLSGDDQLIREAELLLRNYHNKIKFLILLAREESAIAIFNEHKTNIPAEVSRLVI
ncbi:MAG: hypothetical protein APF84_00135 [Gracilibacter sp. BRH_c7a]|nr:MAG: hypothetical protein APF84_00135 [Gracilibacter sp. BRH_c7a]